MDLKLAAAVESFIKDRVSRDEAQNYLRTPLVAFSSAYDPLYDRVLDIVGPQHQRPKDFLPAAQSVISFFMPFRKEVVKCNQAEEPVAEIWGRAYLAVNALINRVNDELCDFLRANGAEAASVPATHTYDPQTLKAAWSHRSAAFVAGLGRFGLNRMLIGKLGCAGRYGTVFTSAALPPAERSEEEMCAYYKNGGCQACLAACPVSALSTDGFAQFKCNDQLLGNTQYLVAKGVSADVCGKCVTAGPCAFKEPSADE